MIQFVQYTPEELQKEIATTVKVELDNFLRQYSPKPPNEYLTRKNVAEMFGVDVSTIHNWCKSGQLKPLGLGRRVYFLRSDVEASLIPIKI